jgi:ABC-2 type transport system permease protein
MRNFFLKTLYQKRHMALWWFLGIMAISALTMSFYHSFQATDISEAFKGLPAGLQKIAGDQSSFKTVDGYIRQQIYTLRLPLLAIILSISLLVGLTAGDEQRGLLETQLSLPVSRTSLLLQKLAASLVIIAAASLGAVVGLFGAIMVLGESFNFVHVLEYTANAVTVAVVYGLVAFTLASVTGRRSLALGIGSGFAFLSYLIDSLAPSVSSLQSLDKLTFFHYYQNDPFSLRNIIVLLVTAVILVVISCIGFNRRDIRQN